MGADQGEPFQRFASPRLSTPFHKYNHVCCVDFQFCEARRGSIPRSGAVTEEQRRQNRKATQPSGRRFFLAQTSLLTPYRRSEEHTSELQSRPHLVCRLLLEKKKQ